MKKTAVLVVLTSLALSATAATTLVGPPWTLVSLRHAGTTLTPQGTERYTLSFQGNGSVLGTVNCNACGGTYTLTPPDTIMIQINMCTDMACPLSQLEGPYSGAIASKSRYAFTGDTLKLYGTDTLSFIAPSTKADRQTGMGPATRKTRSGMTVAGFTGMRAVSGEAYDIHGRRAGSEMVPGVFLRR